MTHHRRSEAVRFAAAAALAIAIAACGEKAPEAKPSPSPSAAPAAPADAPPSAPAPDSPPPAPASDDDPNAQGILVKPIEGASLGACSIWEENGEKRLRENAPPGEMIPILPGRYRLMDQTSTMPFANSVTVKPKETTTVALGAIRLVPMEGAANGVYAIWDATGEKRLREHNEPGSVLSAGPGKYRLTDQSSYTPYAKEVEVKPGAITEVKIGAIKLMPVEGAGLAVYQIHDQTGEKRLREHNEPGVAASAGPGNYRLSDQTSTMPFARDVAVEAGETVLVRIGAIKVVPVEGASAAIYQVYDATGEKRLREHNEPGLALSAGPGKYRLLDQASYLPYAKEIEVKAGETTTVTLGALTVFAIEGADHSVYSIYDATGEKRLREHNEAAKPGSAGPGKYVLMDQASYTPFARDVEVKAGQTAVVALGAIKGPAAAWSLYDATGQKRFRENIEAGALISAGAGKYQVRDQESGKPIGIVEVVGGATVEATPK